MIEDLLTEVCKKVYHKNLEKDLCTIVTPAYELNLDFVTTSLNRSREVCRILLENLCIENDKRHEFGPEQIEGIVNKAFLEVHMSYEIGY